jgi:tRNA(Arg) A34 adenosine deaminase TadA
MNINFMELAIDEAKKNIERGGGPFGAVLVKDGKVISCCGNRVTQDNDPTAHAEVLAIRQASKVLGNWDLSDCEIYSSCEPCPMCLGAIYWAHIPVVYYGANREDAKSAGFDDSVIYDEINMIPLNRKIKMINILRDKAVKGFEEWLKFPGKETY